MVPVEAEDHQVIDRLLDLHRGHPLQQDRFAARLVAEQEVLYVVDRTELEHLIEVPFAEVVAASQRNQDHLGPGIHGLDAQGLQCGERNGG